MKKTVKIFMLAVLAGLLMFTTGCTSTGKNFFGIVKGVVIGDDYEAAGRMVGEAGYMAYVVMKGDPKYDKYTQKAEEIYAALDNAEDFDTKSMNQTILEIMQVALTARYGYVKAVLITDGVRVGGVIADRLILRKVTSEDANLYVKGIKEGVDAARSKTPLTALDDAEKARQEKLAKEKAEKEAKENGTVVEDEWAKAKYITCKPVNKCSYKFTNRSTDVQLRIAQELDKFGFIDPDEQAPDDWTSTKYKNVKVFIERCQRMQKFGVKKVAVWISEAKVECDWKKDETGKEVLDEKGDKIADCKLVSIKFLVEDWSGQTYETDCVGCVMDIELDDISDTASN